MPRLAPRSITLVLPVKGFVQGGENLFRDDRGTLWIQTMYQYDILVAAQPRHSVFGAHRLLQTAPNFPQQFVAHVVTKGVVDFLEPIQIHQHHPKRLLLTPG